MARPKKLKWPVRLEVLLRIYLRNKRPEDRWKIFREWLKWDFKKKFGKEPTDDELQAQMADWQKGQFYHSQNVINAMDSLNYDFLPVFRQSNRERRASIAAKKRWEKRQKSL